jgi:hypothetical protein
VNATQEFANKLTTLAGASPDAPAESGADAPVLGDDLVYSRVETAKLLKICPRTLDRLRPVLPPVLIHGGYKYRREDILKYLRALPPAPMRKPRGVALRGARGAVVGVH